LADQGNQAPGGSATALRQQASGIGAWSIEPTGGSEFPELPGVETWIARAKDGKLALYSYLCSIHDNVMEPRPPDESGAGGDDWSDDSDPWNLTGKYTLGGPDGCTQRGSIRVSTVFLGLDQHFWGDREKPHLLKTMVFRRGRGHEQWRCSTGKQRGNKSARARKWGARRRCERSGR
jgi:hypothetical protein